jgi:lipopolysaccharide transport system permease protein
LILTTSNASAPTASPQTPTIVIEPSKGFVALRLNDVWRYRELLYFLVWRDVKVRYKQTVLGAAWAIIQPLMTMIVFALFFGGLAQIPSDGVPYPIFAYAALVPWTFFANGLSSSGDSLVGSANLIKKIYFPRLIIPIASVLRGVVDFVLAFSVLLLMMVAYQIPLTVSVLTLPFFLLLAFVTALGVGLALSAMNVQFRDVRYTIPFLVQIWLFITPVAYPSSLIESETLRALYSLNPMASVVDGFRWALLGGVNPALRPPDVALLVSSVAALALLLGSLFYFRRMERSFADVV